MYRKKILPLILAVSFLAGFVPSAYAQTAGKTAEETVVAEAVLGDVLEQKGFAKVETGTDKAPYVVERDGSKCWLMNKNGGNSHIFINFALSDEFKGEKDGSEYDIEFEYYDSGSGYVRLFYDSYYKVSTIAETYYTDNAKQWKTAKVTLSDAKFEKRIDNAYDFRLGIKEDGTSGEMSGESVAVRKVTVTKHIGKNPIFVSAEDDEAGDSFVWYADEKIIHNTFRNLTDDEKTVNVRYYLENEVHRTYFEKEETLTFAPKEEKKIDLDFGELRRADVYTYKIQITSEEKNIFSDFELFNIVVLKTDPDGIQNEDVLYCAHLEWYGSEEVKKDGVRLLKMSNVHGIRSSFDWNSMETTKGVLDWNSSNMHFVTEELYRNGLTLLPSLSGPSLYYHEAWNDMPRTAEQLEGWRRFTAYTAEILNGYGYTEYEIWNEPNIANFNKYLDSCRGDAYTELVKIAKEEAEKINPEIKIGGPSVTGINGYWGQDYYTEAMDSGLYKYADAIVLHPYEREVPEICGMDDYIRWYKEKYVEKGIKDPDIWHTEVGYTTADECTVTDEMQGALNCRTALLYKANDLGERICFYGFERKGTVNTNREHKYGNVGTVSGTESKTGKAFIPTLSFAMVTGMNYVMAQSTADGIFDSEDKNVRINRFISDKFGGKIVTVNTVSGTESVTLNLGTDKVTMYDSLGNGTQIYGKDGMFTILAGAKPVYLVGDITETEIVKNKFLEFGGGEITSARNDKVYVSIKDFSDGNYTVSAELPENITLAENNGFVNGTCKMVFENNSAPGEKSRITLKISDGGRLVGSADIDITATESVTSELSVKLDGTGDVNCWKAELNITNISQSEAAKGYVQFKSPESFAKLGKIDMGIIPKGRTGHIEFNLPEISRKGQYALQYDICLENGRKTEFADTVDFTVAAYAENKPVIDGKLGKGEWNMNTAMYADDAGQVKLIQNWGGTDDVSGKVCIMWDEENLYMAAVVTDDIFSYDSPPETNWQSDSIQLGIFYGNEGFVAIGQGKSTYHELGIALSPDGASVYRYLSQDSVYEAGLCETAEAAVSREGNKTYYEMAFPWKDLLRPEDKPPVDGGRLGFSFLINDNDGGGRRGWIEYVGGIDEKNADLFTYIDLIRQSD